MSAASLARNTSVGNEKSARRLAECVSVIICCCFFFPFSFVNNRHIEVHTGPGQSFVFSIRSSKEVPPGSVGFSMLQRKWAVLSLGQDIDVRPFVVDANQHTLTTFVLEADFLQKKRYFTNLFAILTTTQELCIAPCLYYGEDSLESGVIFVMGVLCYRSHFSNLRQRHYVSVAVRQLLGRTCFTYRIRNYQHQWSRWLFYLLIDLLESRTVKAKHDTHENITAKHWW